MKKFTSVHDVANIHSLVQSGLDLKKNPFVNNALGNNKTLGMVFFNPSLRTRMSTQKAAYNLGMNVMVLNVDKDSWALETRDGVVMDGDKVEHVKEAIPVMGQYCDMIGVRSFAGLQNRQTDYEEEILTLFLKLSGIPVISLESATRHPLQSLADLMTIEEFKTSEKPKIVLTWAPHVKPLPQAVANSFAEWILNFDYELTIAHPHGFELAEEFSHKAKLEYDQLKALENADFIYVKNWSSYKDYGQTASHLRSWTVDQSKLIHSPKAKVMHCLPVRRNLVLADDILDSSSSIVIAQAANREYAAQAVLKEILENI